MPLLFCGCSESLSDCVVRVGGHVLGPRWPEPLVGCRRRARVHRRRAGDGVWRRLDLAAGNRPAHRNPVRLDWVRPALGRQSPGQPKPLRRADLCSIRPDRTRSPLYGETAFEHYAIGEPTPNTYNGLDYSGLGLRQKLWSTGEWIFSGEATAFIPGAHDSRRRLRRETPGGRGRRDSTRAAISLLSGLGWFPGIGSVPGFLDAEVAYRLRTEGPPDEWHGDLTVGFKFTPQIMLMLQDFTTVSMSTKDPTFPAWRRRWSRRASSMRSTTNGRFRSACSRPFGRSGPTPSMASRSPCGEISERAFIL